VLVVADTSKLRVMSCLLCVVLFAASRWCSTSLFIVPRRGRFYICDIVFTPGTQRECDIGAVVTGHPVLGVMATVWSSLLIVWGCLPHNRSLRPAL